MGLFVYTQKGSIISMVDLPTTEIIEPQKVKLFPKIWISTLAIFSVAVGFIAGLAVDKQDQQTFEKQPIGFTESGNRPRPKFREDQSSSDSNQVPNDDETDATSGASQKDSSQDANSQ